MAAIAKRVAPLSYEAWIDYELAGAHLSRSELDVLRALLEPRGDGIGVRAAGGAVEGTRLKELGLSAREARELLEKLEPRPRPDFELDLASMVSAEDMAARMAQSVPEPSH